MKSVPVSIKASMENLGQMAWMNTMANLSKGLENELLESSLTQEPLRGEPYVNLVPVASKASQACVCAGSSLKGTSMPWRREARPPCANSVNKAWKKPAPSS
eukprot:2299582-Amphidinium_carterae.1